MVTLKDLAEDWIKARAALKKQIKMLESNAAFPQAELPEDVRNAITARIYSWAPGKNQANASKSCLWRACSPSRAQRLVFPESMKIARESAKPGVPSGK